MQISSDLSDIPEPASRGPSVQWIGVQWQGGSYALPLSCLAAVFKTNRSEPSGKRPELDIEVHDGAPVFMRAFSHCFHISSPKPPQNHQEDLKWALILNVPGSTPLGCRVHQVVGPFWDELKSSTIVHDGQEWLLVQVRGGVHA